MIIKYVNNFNEAIHLNESPYRIMLDGLFDYQHDVREVDGRMAGFEKYKVKTKSISVDVSSKNGLSADKNLMTLSDVFNKDIIAGKPGRLYVGEWYLVCYISGRSSTFRGDHILVSCEFKITHEEDKWFKELTKQFLPKMQTSVSSGLNFPYDYAFDFASNEMGSATWHVEHYAPSNFKMTIYGPCVEPRVLINGYPYQIFTELESSDYLVIDSTNNTIEKHMASGTTANLYNSRQFSPSVFEKIPHGQLSFHWNGSFGFDLTLCLERSEPKW